MNSYASAKKIMIVLSVNQDFHIDKFKTNEMESVFVHKDNIIMKYKKNVPFAIEVVKLVKEMKKMNA